jgi:hypothetical protein
LPTLRAVAAKTGTRPSTLLRDPLIDVLVDAVALLPSEAPRDPDFAAWGVTDG